jgi:hypothetical protein
MTQPYRKGPRMPGAALSAMLRGSPRYLPNPQTAKRRVQRISRAKRRRPRP